MQIQSVSIAGLVGARKNMEEQIVERFKGGERRRLLRE